MFMILAAKRQRDSCGLGERGYRIRAFHVRGPAGAEVHATGAGGDSDMQACLEGVPRCCLARLGGLATGTAWWYLDGIWGSGYELLGCCGETGPLPVLGRNMKLREL